jgi:hypothetical protein
MIRGASGAVGSEAELCERERGGGRETMAFGAGPRWISGEADDA